MKLSVYFILLLFTFNLFSSAALSQKFIDTYYNYAWKETPTRDDASFFSHAIITDSGWYRMDYLLTSGKSSIQMTGLYEDKENKIQNGSFRWYFPNGNLKQSGSYIHGKKTGTWMEWYPTGSLKDSLSYSNGRYSNISQSWYKNGHSKDSLNLDENGNGIYASWFNDGTPSEAGRYKNFNKSGKWVYYHKNGNISSLETYGEDTLKSFQYYDENGLAQNDTLANDSRAYFKGGKKGWNNYVMNSLHFPTQIDIINSDHIVVVVETTIDEEGNPTDSEITVPFYPAFDKEALRFISHSPKWMPAISHNRRVADTFSLSIEFGQSF